MTDFSLIAPYTKTGLFFPVSHGTGIPSETEFSAVCVDTRDSGQICFANQPGAGSPTSFVVSNGSFALTSVVPEKPLFAVFGRCDNKANNAFQESCEVHVREEYDGEVNLYCSAPAEGSGQICVLANNGTPVSFLMPEGQFLSFQSK